METDSPEDAGLNCELDETGLSAEYVETMDGAIVFLSIENAEKAHLSIGSDAGDCHANATTGIEDPDDLRELGYSLVASAEEMEERDEQ